MILFLLNIVGLNKLLKDLIVHLNFLTKLQIGYVSDDGANTHLCLFVAYYNFLRPHSYTYWKPLNEVPELEKAELMPAKWQILIELSQQLILQQKKLDFFQLHPLPYFSLIDLKRIDKAFINIVKII